MSNLKRFFAAILSLVMFSLFIGCGSEEPNLTPMPSQRSAQPSDDAASFARTPQEMLDQSSDASSAQSMSHKEIIQLAESSVVYIVIRDAVGDDLASGTGFVVDGEGHIATNFHVISKAATAIAQTKDGEKMDITGVVAYDPDNDIAILSVDELVGGLVPFELEQPEIEQGDTVTAVGHPSGFQFTATNGIISAVRKASELPEGFKESVGSDDDTTWIQTSAAISGGNSGGPLLDDHGRVIGINTWVAGGQNLGFAIHVRHLVDVMDNRGESRPLPIPGMGIVTDPAVAELQREFELEYDVLLDALRSATTKREIQKIREEQTPFADYGKQFLELAESHEGAGKLQAITQAIRTLKRSSDKDDRQKCVELVDRLFEFVDSPELVDGAMALAGMHEEEAIAALRRMVQECPGVSTKGVACISLAECMKAANEIDVALMKSSPGDMQPEYIALLERATGEFGDGRYRGHKISKVFEGLLKRNLIADGMVAPEIEGESLDGMTRRLSDLRGKVVIVKFWADWCPYCRQMYPISDQLIKKYEDEEFAFVGVNCDEGDRGSRASRSNAMKWPSWKNALEGSDSEDSISGDWGVRGYPSLFVLDRDGIIRGQLSATDFKTLDKVVSSMLENGKDPLSGDLLEFGSDWKVWDSTQKPPADWSASTVDDSSWDTLPAPFGFAKGEATVLPHEPMGSEQPLSFYFRKEFTVDDPTAIENAAIAFRVDDGVCVFVNGKEAFRSNITLDAAHDSEAVSPRKGNGRRTEYASLDPALLTSGKNVIAVAVHQASIWSADLRFDLSVSTNVVGVCEEMLDDDDTNRQLAVLSLLNGLGKVGLPVAKKVKSLLKSKDDRVRVAAYMAMVSMAGTRADEIKAPAPPTFRDMGGRGQIASALNNRSWSVSMHPNCSQEDYRRALVDIMTSYGLKRSGGALNTQALALVRMNKPILALKTLAEARKKHGDKPHDFAVAAMAYQTLGKDGKVTDLLERVKEIAKEREDEADADFDTLIAEVESAVSGN